MTYTNDVNLPNYHISFYGFLLFFTHLFLMDIIKVIFLFKRFNINVYILLRAVVERLHYHRLISHWELSRWLPLIYALPAVRLFCCTFIIKICLPEIISRWSKKGQTGEERVSPFQNSLDLFR